MLNGFKSHAISIIRHRRTALQRAKLLKPPKIQYTFVKLFAMSKILKVAGILVVLTIMGAGIIWYYLPSMVAKAIVKEENSVLNVIPVPVKKSINKKMDEIPRALKALEAEGVYFTIDDVIKVIDEAKEEEIIKTIDILEHTPLQTTDQVIHIVLENMDFGKFENEKIIALARQKLKMSDVRKVMKMIRENGKPYVLTIPMGKETVKNILFEKKKKIETALNS